MTNNLMYGRSIQFSKMENKIYVLFYDNNAKDTTEEGKLNYFFKVFDARYEKLLNKHQAIVTEEIIIEIIDKKLQNIKKIKLLDFLINPNSYSIALFNKNSLYLATTYNLKTKNE